MILSEREEMKVKSDREMEVYKRNDMIQKARFSLSVQEQKTILYAISKIKPTDTHLTEYTFDIKDFYRLIGWEKESYTEFKQMLRSLADKSWWMDMGNGTESLVRWFTTVRSNKKSGKVTVEFHKDMMPYLIQLASSGEYYTSYSLQYVLPMSGQYSPRLYEILKSYQRNNREWFFDIEDLKRVLDCTNYQRWPDFRRYVLEPAMEEINKYTDLKIMYTPEKEGRKITRVVFSMKKKTEENLLEAKRAIRDKLDGQVTIEKIEEAAEAGKAKRTFFRNEN